MMSGRSNWANYPGNSLISMKDLVESKYSKNYQESLDSAVSAKIDEFREFPRILVLFDDSGRFGGRITGIHRTRELNGNSW